MKQTFLSGIIYLLLLCAGCSSSPNALQLADIFGEGMVLQQSSLNNFWGKASPSSRITVEIQDQKSTTHADTNGSWRLSLAGLKPGGPYTLKVTSGNETLLLSDVYVGEVWLASGQSNMERRLSMSENGEEVAANANNPNIRFLLVPKISYDG